MCGDWGRGSSVTMTACPTVAERCGVTARPAAVVATVVGATRRCVRSSRGRDTVMLAVLATPCCRYTTVVGVVDRCVVAAGAAAHTSTPPTTDTDTDGRLLLLLLFVEPGTTDGTEGRHSPSTALLLLLPLETMGTEQHTADVVVVHGRGRGVSARLRLRCAVPSPPTVVGVIHSSHTVSSSSSFWRCCCCCCCC